jgi:NAD(P)H-hydrate epimerase
MAAFDKPIVIDADGLNLLAKNPEWMAHIPPGSILTPHPKEFERLFGKTNNDFEKLHVALEQAKKWSVIIVLKGHYTFIATPQGKGYFNSTGNAGMATAGSGDVLTGILTGLLSQGYAPDDATVMGVFLHGLAGDIAAASLSMESMMASDITGAMGKAFNQVAKT